VCRLGHKEQKDEWTPRVVETFQRANVLPPNALVAAGSAYSAATAGISAGCCLLEVYLVKS